MRSGLSTDEIPKGHARGLPFDGAPFDVHELSAEIEGRRQNRPPLLFAPVEAPAFPHGAAGHDSRHAPAVERAANVEIGDAVETQLHHVASHRGIAGGKELGHRSAGHGLAEWCHRAKKNAPAACG